jgi:hypothetical protein
MLIHDLKYFKESANYLNTTSGMDHPDTCNFSSEDWHAYPVQDFDYQFNSWGFRGPEYTQFIGKPVNICLGDSFTVNLGGPIEHSWCSQLALHFDVPTLNLGMDGAGNDAIRLVYDRACKIFDVQNTFVMYSYLHRRLVENKFEQKVFDSSENFKYFLEYRIPNVFECALPSWNWINEEKQFLSNLEIYFFDIPNVLYFSDYQTIDRKFVNKDLYNNFRGNDWPTLEQFIQGAEPHKDMFTKEFGQFLSNHMYTNRDGHHMNQETNKIYADYFYNQWKLKNEPQNITQT